jgi:hypothetical protein
MEHVATYLNDHLAGASVAIEVVDRLEAENPDLLPSLSLLKSDIASDRQQLLDLMRRLAIPESRARTAGAFVAETAAEIKIAMDDDPKGPLRLLERLEALAVGIYGKIALWRALEAALPSNSLFAGLDYPRLVERAEDQRVRVEALRLQAAPGALAQD